MKNKKVKDLEDYTLDELRIKHPLPKNLGARVPPHDENCSIFDGEQCDCCPDNFDEEEAFEYFVEEYNRGWPDADEGDKP